MIRVGKIAETEGEPDSRLACFARVITIGKSDRLRRRRAAPGGLAGESGRFGRAMLALQRGLCRPSQSAEAFHGSDNKSVRLSSSVLVLNRFYMAVHVVNVRRAFGLLFRELAEVIHFEEGQYANYNFESWREISELKASFKEPHEDWIRGGEFRDASAARDSPVVLRSRAEADDSLQSPQFFRPRRQPLPVLRQEFPDQRTEPGSRGAAKPQRRDLLGKHRLRLRGLQRAKGGRTPQEAHMKLIRPPVKPKRSPLLASSSAIRSTKAGRRSWIMPTGRSI